MLRRRWTSRASAASSSAAGGATATPQEQQEYLKLFEETLIRNLSARFGEYQGVRFSLGRSQQRTEEDVLVNTIVERPNNAPFALDWRVAKSAASPRWWT